MDPEIQELLKAAADDVATLRYALPARILGFHAQQAIEKWMKALIAAHGERFAWTHSLEFLEEHLHRSGEVLPATPYPLDPLQKYAANFRYGGDPPLLDSGREAIHRTVDQLELFFLGRLAALQA